MRKKIVKSFAFVILTILCTMLCFACTDKEESFELVGEPIFICVYNEETKQYDVAVEGLAKNNSDEKFTYVYVTIKLYDENHHLVGQARDSIDLVLAQETWHFCTTTTTHYEVASVELYKFD